VCIYPCPHPSQEELDAGCAALAAVLGRLAAAATAAAQAVAGDAAASPAVALALLRSLSHKGLMERVRRVPAGARADMWTAPSDMCLCMRLSACLGGQPVRAWHR
jgi:hypothetical protein